MMIRKFVGRLIVFLLPVLLGFCVWEYFLRAIPNDYSYKKQYLEQNAKDIEVLILGNSHYYRSVLAEDLYLNGFNAAYISQSLNIDFLIFNKYKDRMKNLKYLMIGISYPSLFSSLESQVEYWRIKNYNLYYDFNLTNLPKNYSEVLSNTFEVNKKKIINYYWHHDNPITQSRLGSGAKRVQKDLYETGINSSKRHTHSKLPFYKDYLKQINGIIEYCNENQIKILLVTSPTYHTYYENLNTVQLSKMNYLLDSIAQMHQNVYRLNYLKSKNFIAEDFYDADHMRLQGAIKFTEILNQKLDSL